MINNFMCEDCSHNPVCEKLKSLLKFHDTAKKDLKIELTMDDCYDFKDENDEPELSADKTENEND